MRFAVAILSGFVSVLAGHLCSAQELPVFDDGDFEVVSLEPNSKVIARSDGREFYCYADLSAAGYILVGGCVPFVGGNETAEANFRWAKAVAAERQAAEAAAIRAAEAARIASARAAEAAKVAAEINAREIVDKEKEKQKKFDDMFAAFGPEQAANELIVLAKRYQCTLHLENRTINVYLVRAMLLAAGFQNDKIYDRNLIKVAQNRFNKAMNTLIAAGTAEFALDGQLLIFKDCK